MQHIIVSEQCLALYEYNPTDFLRQSVTVDEAWIQVRDKTVKTVGSQGTTYLQKRSWRLVFFFFLERWKHLLVDYLKKAVNTRYCANQLKQQIKEEKPNPTKKKILFIKTTFPTTRLSGWWPKLMNWSLSLLSNLEKFLAGKKYVFDTEVFYYKEGIQTRKPVPQGDHV